MHLLIKKKTQIFDGNWSPKGAQRDPKIEELGGQFGHPPPDLPRGTKWSQNGPNMDPKWSQNGAKMDQNGPNMELRWSENRAINYDVLTS